MINMILDKCVFLCNQICTYDKNEKLHTVCLVISNYATPVVHILDPCFRSIMQRMAKLILRK